MANKITSILVAVFMAVSIFSSAFADENQEKVRQVANLANFAAKLGQLESISDDIVLSAALSLLRPSHPELKFPEVVKHWSDEQLTFSNDVAAVAAYHEYKMQYHRRLLAKNVAASEEQRKQAMEIIDFLRQMIDAAREFEKLQKDGEAAALGAYYQDQILGLASKISDKVKLLTDALNLQIKLSSI